MTQFNYIIDKIKSAKILLEPFEHIYIENLILPEQFKQIMEESVVNISYLKDDVSLIKKLRKSGYLPISFPGCTKNEMQYLRWHGDKKWGYDNVNTCEGFGIAYRLHRIESALIRDLVVFFGSDILLKTMADRFGVDVTETVKDTGLQKYLDGYEISPHPDTRRKALTYMVNLNPGDTPEQLNIHTHYMKFKKNKEPKGSSAEA